MKHFTSYFLILLSVLLVLVGCQDDKLVYTKHLPQNTTDVTDYRISEDAILVSSNLAYSRQDASIPEYLAEEPLDSRFFYMSDGYFYAPIPYQPVVGEAVLELVILKFDESGTLVEEIQVPGNHLKTGAVWVLSGNRFLIHRDNSERMRDFQNSSLQIIDAENTVLVECKVPSFSSSIGDATRSETYRSIHVSEHDDGTMRILVNAVDKVYYYDESLTMLSALDVPSECLRVTEIGEDVYILGEELPHLYRVDFAVGTVVRIEALPVPAEWYYSSQFYWDDQGVMYCFRDGAVYRCEEQSDGHVLPTLILKWSMGACNGSGIATMLNPDTVVLYSSAGVLFDECLYFLGIGEGRAVENRQVLQMVCVGGNLDWLLELTAEYNARSDTHFIELTDLSRIENGRTSTQRFQDYLLQNPFPDLVTFGSMFRVTDYAEKGVLLDLYPYFGDLLIGCASNAFMNHEGKQYGLPLSMQLSTLVSASSVQDTSLTWDDLYAIEAELLSEPEGSRTAIVSTAISGELYRTSRAYYDDAAGSAWFDTGEFETQVAFLERMNTQYCNQSAGGISNFLGNYLLYRGTSILAEIQTGEVKFLNFPLTTPASCALLNYVFGDTPYTLCGYPTKDGTKTAVEINSNNIICVSAQSVHQDRCLDFLSFMLSDEIQTADVLVRQSMPVTRSAIRSQLKAYQYATVSPIPSQQYLDYIGYEITPEISTKEIVESLSSAHTDGVVVTDEEIAVFLDFLETCQGTAYSDATIVKIIDEELSAWKSGARTLSDAVKLIQSRVWIYVNE